MEHLQLCFLFSLFFIWLEEVCVGYDLSSEVVEFVFSLDHEVPLGFDGCFFFEEGVDFAPPREGLQER